MPLEKGHNHVCMLTPSSASSSSSSSDTMDGLCTSLQSKVKVDPLPGLTSPHATAMSTHHTQPCQHSNGSHCNAREIRTLDQHDHEDNSVWPNANTNGNNKNNHSHPTLMPLTMQHTASTPTSTMVERLNFASSPPPPSTGPPLCQEKHTVAETTSPQPHHDMRPVADHASIPTHGSGKTRSQLASMLDDKDNPPLLIDARSVSDYDQLRIRDAINVHLPTLIVKRFRRGIVSNFSLENFMATKEDKQRYFEWLQRQRRSKKPACIVVYDDRMDRHHPDSHGWILAGVLKMSHGTDRVGTHVHGLEGGFDAFRQWEAARQYMTGTDMVRGRHTVASNAQPCPSTSTSTGRHPWSWCGSDAMDAPASDHPTTSKGIPTAPTQSRSATTFSSGPSLWTDGTNVQRRASLFSLDTSRARTRSRHGGAAQSGLARAKTARESRLTERSWDHGSMPLSVITEATAGTPQTSSPRASATTSLITPPEMENPSTHTPQDNKEPEDGFASSGENTPTSDMEQAFIVSEIVPGFLYLGPEISTPEQLEKVRLYPIKRVLNMAEECDDDVPGLKETLAYHKLAARDTVEMQNVEGTLRKAVGVINDAKRCHDPIYVHCKAGKSRSVAVILAYLVLSERWTLKRAYQHVILARPIMSPNIGFVAELMKLEESVHGKVSNFGSPNWQHVDVHNPPSPGLQQDIRKLASAWQS